MKTLTLATSNFDQVNTFRIGGNGFAAHSLHQGYNSKDDGVYWAMMHSAAIKSSYSAADIAEGRRLIDSTPIDHDEIVMIDGKLYTCSILGRYSNAAIFTPV